MGILINPLFWRRDLDHSQHLDGSIQALLFAEFLMEDKHLRDLISNREDRIERGHRLLKDHGDPVPPDSPHVGHGKLEEVCSTKVNPPMDDPSRWFRYEAHDRESRHTLATAGLADQPQSFSPIQIEAHIIDGLRDALEGVEMCLEPLYLKKVRVVFHSFLSRTRHVVI